MSEALVIGQNGQLDQELLTQLRTQNTDALGVFCEQLDINQSAERPPVSRVLMTSWPATSVLGSPLNFRLRL